MHTPVTHINQEKNYTILLRGEYDIAEAQAITTIVTEALGEEGIPFVLCTTHTGYARVQKKRHARPVEQNSHLLYP